MTKSNSDARPIQSRTKKLDDVGYSDVLIDSVHEWTAGNVLMDLFGSQADDLDALFLLAWVARNLHWILNDQIEICRGDGRSWNEIGVALGMSRQAARKRFGSPGVNDRSLTALRPARKY